MSFVPPLSASAAYTPQAYATPQESAAGAAQNRNVPPPEEAEAYTKAQAQAKAEAQAKQNALIEEWMKSGILKMKINGRSVVKAPPLQEKTSPPPFSSKVGTIFRKELTTGLSTSSNFDEHDPKVGYVQIYNHTTKEYEDDLTRLTCNDKIYPIPIYQGTLHVYVTPSKELVFIETK